MARRYSHDEAAALMRAAGMDPLETYPGAVRPWRSRCMACGAEGAPRLNNLTNGLGGCKPCGDRKRWGRERTGDLAGRTFGKWTVLNEAPRVGSHRYWFCRCVCGAESPVIQNDLVRSRSTQCGQCGNTANRKHGLSGWGPYQVWYNMVARCTDPDDAGYANYGGRGITVCERWLPPAGRDNFIDDMGRTYEPGLSIDREDNDGPYSPENCRWATANEQGRNRRSNVVIQWGMHSKTVMEWSQTLGINYGALWWRLNNWDPARAMTEGVLPELVADITDGRPDCCPEIVQWHSRTNHTKT